MGLLMLNVSSCLKSCLRNLMGTRGWPEPLPLLFTKMRKSKRASFCNFSVEPKRTLLRLDVVISGLKLTFCSVEIPVHLNPNCSNMFTSFYRGLNTLLERVHLQ